MYNIYKFMYVFSQHSYGHVIKLTSDMGDQRTQSIMKEVYAKSNPDLGLQSS